MAKLIKSWDGLVGLESDEYYLEIDVDRCNGHIRSKTDKDFYAYLSTHTMLEVFRETGELSKGETL